MNAASRTAPFRRGGCRPPPWSRAGGARPVDSLCVRNVWERPFEKPLVHQSPDAFRAQAWVLAAKPRVQELEAQLVELEHHAKALMHGRQRSWKHERSLPRAHRSSRVHLCFFLLRLGNRRQSRKALLDLRPALTDAFGERLYGSLARHMTDDEQMKRFYVLPAEVENANRSHALGADDARGIERLGRYLRESINNAWPKRFKSSLNLRRPSSFVHKGRSHRLQNSVATICIPRVYALPLLNLTGTSAYEPSVAMAVVSTTTPYFTAAGRSVRASARCISTTTG